MGFRAQARNMKGLDIPKWPRVRESQRGGSKGRVVGFRVWGWSLDRVGVQGYFVFLSWVVYLASIASAWDVG